MSSIPCPSNNLDRSKSPLASPDISGAYAEKTAGWAKLVFKQVAVAEPSALGEQRFGPFRKHPGDGRQYPSREDWPAGSARRQSVREDRGIQPTWFGQGPAGTG